MLSRRDSFKMYPRYTLGAIMKLAVKIFFLPGDLISGLVGATKPDDRMMIRMFVDMVFWSCIVIIGAWMIFR